LAVAASERGSLSAGRFSIDGRFVGTRAPLVHGSTISIGDVSLVALDLEVPEPGTELSLDVRRPRVRVLDRAGRDVVEPYELAREVALVGASIVCDIRIDDAPNV